MSVYTHDLRPCLKSNSWPWSQSAHLWADSLEELHAFAVSIGLKRKWLHAGGGTFPHYDLSPGKHRQAIAAGAIHVTRFELAEDIRKWRTDTSGVKAKL